MVEAKQKKVKRPAAVKLKPPAEIKLKKPYKLREAAVVSQCKKYESQLSVKGDRYVLKPLAATDMFE